MILRFRHKGLERFYRSGSVRGIRVDHAARLARILAALDSATRPDDLKLPGFQLHPLKGNLKGHFSIWVSGNWRITFRFDGTDVEQVDYVDYH